MKTSLRFLTLLCLVGLFMYSCTPKVVEEVKKEPEKKVVQKTNPNEVLSKCPKFSDSDNESLAMEKHVLYRDHIKMKNYDAAFPLWKEVFAMAPAADGRRNTHYSDGIKIYQHMMDKETDKAKKDQYLDKIFELYDGITECYPKDAGYVAGRKGFDYYYKYPQRATDLEKYNLFKKSLDLDGENARDFVVNPFTDLLIRMYNSNKVKIDEAKKYTQIINNMIAKGMKTSGRKLERWKVINDYAPIRLEEFERVKGFYDCEYYVNRYYSEYEEDPNDCDNIDITLGRLMWGGCSSSHPKIAQLNAARNSKCQTIVVSSTPSSSSGGGSRPTTSSGGSSTSGPIKAGYAAFRSGDYNTAISSFESALAQTSDPEKKAKIQMLMSKIYYANLRNYGKARKYARDAANSKPNWGDPYILIGKLYASSGPLCGSGRGFESQRVVWAAMDMWNKAKKVDPNAASKANSLIGKYRAYMPSSEDIFMLGLKKGQSYKIPCWIQTTTTVR